MGIGDSFSSGYNRSKPKPQRSLMPMINKVAGMRKSKGSGRVTVAAAAEKKKKKPEETPKTKGAALASDKGAGLANPKRM